MLDACTISRDLPLARILHGSVVRRDSVCGADSTHDSGAPRQAVSASQSFAVTSGVNGTSNGSPCRVPQPRCSPWTG